MPVNVVSRSSPATVLAHVFRLPAIGFVALALNGCLYLGNRAADLGDIFQLGGGVTMEQPKGGPFPPSLGIHVQATEFLNLGALYFNGVSAELDGRGTFAGREERLRLGFLPWQRIKLWQDYDRGWENYFKKPAGLWSRRMQSPEMSWRHRPAKRLEYTYYETGDSGPLLMHRGSQYWENINLEFGLSEPFITHFGFNLRAGVDLSEVSDFVLGILFIDFKRDDLTDEEQEDRGAAEPGSGLIGEPLTFPLDEIPEESIETIEPVEPMPPRDNQDQEPHPLAEDPAQERVPLADDQLTTPAAESLPAP